MSQLALFASFEYLCHGSVAIINILIISVCGPPSYVRIWRLQYRRQILTFKDDPHVERVKHLVSNHTNMSLFHPVEVVCRDSETQLEVGENLN